MNPQATYRGCTSVARFYCWEIRRPKRYCKGTIVTEGTKGTVEKTETEERSKWAAP